MDEQLTTLAHDMRTPVTVLKMAVNLLASLSDSPEARSLVVTAEANLKRLEQIADRIDSLADEYTG